MSTDESGTASDHLDVSNFRAKSAFAQLDHHNRQLESYFVQEECLITKVVEISLFEALASVFVFHRYNHLAELQKRLG